MITVLGETVVDLLPVQDGLLRPVCGGGPANTAVMLAKMGVPVAMAARLGGDALAGPIARRLTDAGVDDRFVVGSADPSTLALAGIDAAGHAKYDFWTRGAADFGWRDAELPDDPAITAVHFGSLTAYLEPGADAVRRWVSDMRRGVPVSFDPNIRPGLMGSVDEARERTERLVGLAQLVRASDADIAALYGDRPPDQVARHWLASGATLVLVTRGPDGAAAYHRAGSVAVPAPEVTVVDTIGAGDTFTAGMLAWLHRHDLLALDRLSDWTRQAVLTSMLEHAVAAAAEACTVAGAPA